MDIFTNLLPGAITGALISKAFLSLLVVIDPPANGIIYLGLVRRASAVEKLAMALRGHLVAFFVLALFALFGARILASLGIGMAAFRIASGFMLFVVGLEMTMRKRNDRRRAGAENVVEKGQIEDVSVFPLGVPLLAGPGAIAAVLLPTAEIGGSLAEGLTMLAIVGAVLLISFASFVIILKFQRLQRNAVIEEVLTRLMGLLLSALAAQFMIDGIKQAFG